jgi:glycosyltransferase involved in cell wall biosynthesis
VKRILILIKGLGRGGAEQLLVNAAPYLDRTTFGYEVAYLLPWKDALVPELEAVGIGTRCLDGARGGGWVPRFRSVVAEHEIDLVHAHSPYPAALARMALRGQRHLPFVYTEHGVWERQRGLTYWGNLLTFPRNDHVFAVSELVSRSIRYPRGLRARRMPPLETLHHGIDPAALRRWNDQDGVRDELGIPGDAPMLATVGNLRAAKGHSLLLEAAEQVRSEFPRARFVIVGQGPLERALRAEVRARGLEDTVLLTGFRDDAPRLVSACDVFVLPSLFEGLSIALLEAMSLGKASVVTRVGGLPEQVTDGIEALVVPPGSPHALAEAITRLLKDEPLRTSMGLAARGRSALFDIRPAVRRMEQVYGDLIA